MNLTPEQKLRRNIKFTLDRNPEAGAPESIAVLIEVAACVLNVMRKALVSLGAPESVLAAHDDGDGDVVEKWIEAQPRRVPIAEGQQDTSAQDCLRMLRLYETDCDFPTTLENIELCRRLEAVLGVTGFGNDGDATCQNCGGTGEVAEVGQSNP